MIEFYNIFSPLTLLLSIISSFTMICPILLLTDINNVFFYKKTIYKLLLYVSCCNLLKNTFALFTKYLSTDQLCHNRSLILNIFTLFIFNLSLLILFKLDQIINFKLKELTIQEYLFCFFLPLIVLFFPFIDSKYENNINLSKLCFKSIVYDTPVIYFIKWISYYIWFVIYIIVAFFIVIKIYKYIKNNNSITKKYEIYITFFKFCLYPLITILCYLPNVTINIFQQYSFVENSIYILNLHEFFLTVTFWYNMIEMRNVVRKKIFISNYNLSSIYNNLINIFEKLYITSNNSNNKLENISPNINNFNTSFNSNRLKNSNNKLKYISKNSNNKLKYISKNSNNKLKYISNNSNNKLKYISKKSNNRLRYIPNKHDNISNIPTNDIYINTSKILSNNMTITSLNKLNINNNKANNFSNSMHVNRTNKFFVNSLKNSVNNNSSSLSQNSDNNNINSLLKNSDNNNTSSLMQSSDNSDIFKYSPCGDDIDCITAYNTAYNTFNTHNTKYYKRTNLTNIINKKLG